MRLHLSHLQARGHIYHAPTFQCCLRMQKLQMGAEHTQQVMVAGRRHSSQVTTSCMRGGESRRAADGPLKCLVNKRGGITIITESTPAFRNSLQTV